jgi:hypothetical protein
MQHRARDHKIERAPRKWEPEDIALDPSPSWIRRQQAMREIEGNELKAGAKRLRKSAVSGPDLED